MKRENIVQFGYFILCLPILACCCLGVILSRVNRFFLLTLLRGLRERYKNGGIEVDEVKKDLNQLSLILILSLANLLLSVGMIFILAR